MKKNLFTSLLSVLVLCLSGPVDTIYAQDAELYRRFRRWLREMSEMPEEESELVAFSVSGVGLIEGFMPGDRIWDEDRERWVQRVEMRDSQLAANPSEVTAANVPAQADPVRMIPDDLLIPYLFFDAGEVALDTVKCKWELFYIVALLQNYPDVEIVLEGFTDQTGDAGTNERLALQRARSVADYLISRGIAPGRLTVLEGGKDVRIWKINWGPAIERRVELTPLMPLRSLKGMATAF